MAKQRANPDGLSGKGAIDRGGAAHHPLLPFFLAALLLVLPVMGAAPGPDEVSPARQWTTAKSKDGRKPQNPRWPHRARHRDFPTAIECWRKSPALPPLDPQIQALMPLVQAPRSDHVVSPSASLICWCGGSEIAWKLHLQLALRRLEH